MITAGEMKNVQFFSNNVGTTIYAAPEQLNSKVYRAFELKIGGKVVFRRKGRKYIFRRKKGEK